MTLSEFQKQIEKIYYDKDVKRGIDKDFLWFLEEVGELARAVRKGNKDKLKDEFADVIAWVASLASLNDIKLEDVVSVYSNGCPDCGEIPCQCPEPG